MELFDTIHESEHEQIVFCHNKDAGLKVIRPEVLKKIKK